MFFTFACLALCAAAMLGGADIALAQGSPFGVGPPRPAAPSPPPDGIVAWIIAKQAEFYRQFSGLIRAAKADGSAVWALLGVSFLYGVFHAVGPGHGKAVISSYLVANDETWRRGIVLSFASALMQALVAVAVVGIAAALLGASARTMTTAVRWIEITSYALIAALGAWLMWVKGRALVATLRDLRAPAPAPIGAAVTRGHHGHAHDHRHHGHSHSHDAHCGHSHGPAPGQLGGPGGWQRGLSAILAVGLRPCSGAILVLVFALAQGLFWAGVASTFVMGLGTAIAVATIATLAVGAKGLAVRVAAGGAGYGSVAVRGLELAAAAAVLAFGVLLLLGYIASERLGMV
ncbi:MAG TPA: nickel/cobalt transporter [Xanthobacteraceae bacterium]|nr:nickel/cobalt transporter [Xanthobacteraceae bacterium]